MFCKSRKGQNTLEYALLITVVVVGILAVQNYIRRGVQGKMKESADDLGSQFAPGTVKYDWTTWQHGLRKEETTLSGVGQAALPTTTSTIKSGAGDIADGEYTSRWGNETVDSGSATAYGQSKE